MAIATYWVSPAAPIPTTLPVSIWRGEAALIISSMTRLLFSAATPGRHPHPVDHDR